MEGSQDDDDVVVTHEDGQGRVYPRSVRTVHQREIYDEIAYTAAHLVELEAHRDDLVKLGRKLGLSWNSIGAATGYTGMGASARFGGLDGD